MIRTSIAYTDDIGGLPSSTSFKTAIGESKIMEAQYKTDCVGLFGSIVKYNPAFAMATPDYPTIDNSWRITILPTVTVGVWLTMLLEVNGSTQGQDYWSNQNYRVQIWIVDEFNFKIRHKFYVGDDVNGYIAETQSNTYGKWLQNSSIDTQSANTLSTGNSVYESAKYFTKHIKVIDISTSKSDEMLDYDLVTAKFYDNFSPSPITNTWTTNQPQFILDGAIFTQVNFNVPGVEIPTSAKLMLVNIVPENSLQLANPAIIEDEEIGVVSLVAGTNWKVTASLTAKTLQEKEVVALIYFSASTEVISIKLGKPIPNGPLTVIKGCYPQITWSYKDYNRSMNGCIESTLYERVIAEFQVSKTIFNNISLYGGPCYPVGFNNYNKDAFLTVTRQSTGDILFTQGMNYNAGSGLWTTGDVTFTQDAFFLYFSYEYRNIFDYLGDSIVAKLEFTTYYGTSGETVVAESINYVLNYDNALAVPLIDKIELKDPITNAVISSMEGNIMTLKSSCLSYFKVTICRFDLLTPFNIIPVIYEVGTNLISEEESYAGLGVLPQLNTVFFSGVPTSFVVGNLCADFYLDTSTLDRTKDYEIAIIIKKEV